MASNEFIHVRVDSELKTDVESILDELGLTTSQAVRLFFHQIRAWRRLPISLDLPALGVGNGKPKQESKDILTEDELRKVTPFVMQLLRSKAENVP